MLTKTKLAAPLAVAALIGLAACGGASGSDSTGTLKIGVPYPKTGAYADYGANYSDGVRLAVENVNAEGGVDVDGTKVKVKAIFCDTQVDPAKAASCARKLSSQDKVPAMLISTSPETFPVLSFNESDRAPFLVISSSASNKLVTEGNKLVARYWFNTHSYMPEFTGLLKDGLAEEGVTSASIAVMESEDEFGKAWNDTFTAGWKAQGENIAGKATYSMGATDFYPQLTSLLKKKPDVLAIPGVCAQVAPIAKQARELGFDGRFVFQISCGPEEIAKLVKPGLLKGSVFEGSAWDSESDTIKTFKTDFKSMFKRDAVVISADGFAQAMWAITAAGKAGTVDDAVKIRGALGSVVDDDWNILEMKNLEKSGETTAAVHPRFFESATDINDFYGSN